MTKGTMIVYGSASIADLNSNLVLKLGTKSVDDLRHLIRVNMNYIYKFRHLLRHKIK